MRFRPLAALAAIVVACTLTAASCGGGSSGVVVGTVGRGDVVEVVDAPASVTAKAAATLTAPADGTLAALRVRSGERVRAGQVLAIIDSPAAQARLRQAKRALSATRRVGGFGAGGDLSAVRRATDKSAKDAFAAARQAAEQIADVRLRDALLAQVTAAERRYSAAAEAADQAVRAVQRGVASLGSAISALSAAQRVQAQQAYDLAKSTVDALTLRAPISGVVQMGGGSTGAGSGQSLTDLLQSAGVDPGALASTAPGGGNDVLPGVDGTVPLGGRVAAGTAVLTIVDVAELGLLAEVDETDVLLVKPGVVATVELDAATGASYEARVRSVDLLPTPSSRGGVSYRVRLALGAGRYADGRPAPTPRPGMSAVAHLRVREVEDAVTVPAAAVFSADGRDSVWAVRDGKARPVPVTVGVQGQDVVQILSGLTEGQQVVVRGTDKVRAGQQVS
ncbi:MAG: HlyD family efflux transporter periplasmic adaptor subunit [Micromonosporaceae bacterium]|nr:HlyD family efflux transporter periplasmic adaptor subunit [Micromonosporaceae bacterium]